MNRRRVYFSCSVLILLGVLAMRWNVVIGGQLFSKSLRGFMSYKMEFAGHEGWWLSVALLALPFIILTVFIKYFLAAGPADDRERGPRRAAARGFARGAGLRLTRLARSRFSRRDGVRRRESST